MTAPKDAEDWVWLARIRHPQGRKGEVFADILTDFPEKFADRKRLWLLVDKTAAKNEVKSRASGHDFSRAANGENNARASAPAVNALPREVELAAHWLHKGGIVLHFAGVDSISAAETLKGLIVAVPRAERAELGGDEVYTGDLIGCVLVNVAGAGPVTVGEIESVDRTSGPVALLAVQGAAGEVLIPFAKSYLRKIDLKAKRVEMALPEGLVDLNASGKAL
ncbi:MAG: ribosome maturation factor RimM [Terracidiphilus sp.]